MRNPRTLGVDCASVLERLSQAGVPGDRRAQADLKTVVADMLSGQYRHPLRVVAFNTAEGWARDVSADIERQVLNCARELEHELPAAVRDFVERAGA